MRRTHTLAILAILAPLLSSAGQGSAEEAKNSETGRSFLMGFTDWNYGPEDSHQKDTYNRAIDYGDIICFQFNGGIPWHEAYESKPYHPALQKIIDDRLAILQKTRNVYLEFASLNMMRNDFAGHRGSGENMPRPAPWDAYPIDSEEMMTAYANFCIDMINQFSPVYVNYGLESTDYIHHHPENWKSYAKFHQGVYDRIKKVHPNLPLGISMPLKHPDSEEAKALQKGVVDLLPAMDYLAGSAYPFVFFGHENAGNPANLPERWFQQLVDAAHGKPIAIGETNWIAEDLDVDTWNIHVKSNPGWQRDYLAMLLAQCNKHEAAYVIWWTAEDFDLLWETLPDDVKDLAKIWRDTGIFDGDLKPRPALDVWSQWLARPRTVPSK